MPFRQPRSSSNTNCESAAGGGRRVTSAWRKRALPPARAISSAISCAFWCAFWMASAATSTPTVCHPRRASVRQLVPVPHPAVEENVQGPVPLAHRLQSFWRADPRVPGRCSTSIAFLKSLLCLVLCRHCSCSFPFSKANCAHGMSARLELPCVFCSALGDGGKHRRVFDQ